MKAIPFVPHGHRHWLLLASHLQRLYGISLFPGDWGGFPKFTFSFVLSGREQALLKNGSHVIQKG